MKRFLLLFLLLPFFAFTQQQECITIQINNAFADSVTYCVTGTSCYGASDGVIDITVHGSNQPYSFEWFNNSTPWPGVSIQDTLSPDDYIITITDLNGSLVHNSHVNTVPGAPNFSVFENSISSPSCFNYTDGFIDLTISGATPISSGAPYTYLWEDGTSTEDRSGLDSGLYILSMTDANGCNRIDSFELFNPAKVISTTTSDILSCIGACDGDASVLPDSGVGPYTYQWHDVNGPILGENSASVSNLCYGEATVYITDDNGCLDTNTVFIENPDTLKLSSIEIDNACYQICDGEISISISGGSSPYTVSWKDSLGVEFDNINTTIEDLCPALYVLDYTDNNGCVASDTLIVEERDSFNLASSVTDVSCFGECDGEISVQLLNLDNPPLIYLWSNGGSTSIISNLCSDSINLELIDDRGCRDTFYYFIDEPDSISFDSLDIIHNLCYSDQNGAITVVNPTGGVSPITYSWNGISSGSTPGISSLSSGFYDLLIEDANACSLNVANIEITEPNELQAFYSPISASCNGYSDGSVIVNISGGTTPYSINGAILSANDTIFSSLSANDYIYQVVDSNGCTLPDVTITVDEPDVLAMTSDITDVLCHGYHSGIIDVTVTGGSIPYTYQWSGPNTFSSTNADITNLAAGSYSVNILDDNDCPLSSTMVVDEPVLPLTPSLAITDFILCYGDNTGDIDLTLIGGTPSYTFAWNNASTNEDLNNVGAGNYEVTIIDDNGCDTTASIDILEPNEITLTETITNLLCFEDGTGAIDIITQGGTSPYNYSWDNGEITDDISGLMAGNYELTISDDNGCPYSEVFTVTEPDLLVSQAIVIDIDCFGNDNGSINVQVSGGTSPFSYSWDTGESTALIENLQPGSYTVNILDDNDCSDALTAQIQEPAELVLSLVSIQPAICYGEASGSVNIDISGGVGGYEYNWNNGLANTQDISNVQGGNYQIFITDANNCPISGAYFIDQPNPYNPSADILDIYAQNGCADDQTGSIDFSITGNTPPYEYVWSNGETTEDIFNLGVGVYDLTVTDANNCQYDNTYTIYGPDPLTLTYVVTPASCEEHNDGSIYTNVGGGVPPYTYDWVGDGMFVAASSDLTYLSQGTYALTVTDDNGCALDLQTIQVPFEGVTGCIEIPSGFTPNGDTFHDEWNIYGLYYFNSVVVKVYNRWGQEVFSSNGYDNPWDGKRDGVDLPTAAYYYVIEIGDIDKVFNGTVTIKR